MGLAFLDRGLLEIGGDPALGGDRCLVEMGKCLVVLVVPVDPLGEGRHVDDRVGEGVAEGLGLGQLRLGLGERLERRGVFRRTTLGGGLPGDLVVIGEQDAERVRGRRPGREADPRALEPARGVDGDQGQVAAAPRLRRPVDRLVESGPRQLQRECLTR